MDKLIFTEAPAVTIATNTFVRVPVILQYDDTPLIEVVRCQPAGFTTSIPIFHSDGTYLAKVVGSRVVATDAGAKAGITLEHPDKMTVCRLAGRTVFELRRDEAAALRTAAELYTSTGCFVRITDSPKVDLLDAAGALRVGGLIMSHNTFEGCRIGVWVRSDGSVSVGVA